MTLSELCVITYKKYCSMTQVISHFLGKVEPYSYIYHTATIWITKSYDKRLLRVDLLAKWLLVRKCWSLFVQANLNSYSMQCTNIHCSLLKLHDNFGDSLSFHPMPDLFENVTLSSTLLYDQVAAKLKPCVSVSILAC